MNKHTAELLEKHFDIAFTAPDGIKKLRELILTLAMQGRLVPQNPNDQPASELLKEIEAEKQRLVQEGKIKQPKPLPPVTEEEKPYVLPEGWEWGRLQSFADYNGRPNITPSEIGNDIWLLDLEDIEKETSRLLYRAKYSERDSKSTKSTFNAGDVLYGKLRPYLDKVLIADKNGVCTTEIVPVVPSKAVTSEFLRWLLKRPEFLSHVNNLMYGVKMPRLGTEDAIQSIHPLPPVNEQRRIVAKINELMARCDKLEKLRIEQQEKRLTVHAAAIKQLLNIAEPDQHQRAQTFLAKHFDELYIVKENVTELRKAILQLAVMGKLVPQNPDDQPASELVKEIEAEKQQLVKEGKIKKPKPLPPVTEEEKPYALPQGWEWVRFGEISFQITDGAHHTPTYVEEGIPFLSVKDMSSGSLDFSSTRLISQKQHQDLIRRCYPQKGDLLLTKVGTTGIPVLIDIDREFSIFVSVALIKFPQNLVFGKYLSWLIKSPLVKTQSEDGTEGVGNKNLVLRKITSFLLALPPLAEQRHIVAKIDQLMTLCDVLEQQIDATTSKQTELLNALVYAQSLDAPENQQPIAEMSGQKSEVIDLTSYRAAIGCYALNKLANAQYFGRTAAAKVMYLAQAHIGLALDLHPERKAAGPLDKWIYGFERLGLENGWFEVQEIMLTSGRKKAEYRCLPALSVPVTKAESLMSPAQQAEFDRLIYAIAGKTTEQVEIIATLFAVWNDFLLDGIQPTDEQIIREMRENWHERKARFSPSELAQWLDWLRKEQFIPKGQGPRTIQQHNLCNSG